MFNRSLFQKLVIGYMAVLVLTVGTLGIVVPRLFQKYYVEDKASELQSRSDLIMAILSPMYLQYRQEKKHSPQLLRMIRNLDGAFGVRICLRDSRGTIVSRTDAAGPETAVPSLFPIDAPRLQRDSICVTSKDPEPTLSILNLPILDEKTGATAAFIDIHASLTGITATAARMQLVIIATGLMAILLSMGFAFMLSRKILHPLRQIQSAAADMAKGDFSKRVVTNLSDEVGQLAVSFNHLTDSLAKSLKDLKQEKSKMQAMLVSLSEGVVAVGVQERILLMNPSAQEIFGYRAEERPPESVPHPFLRQLFHQCLTTGEEQVGDLSAGALILHVHISPMFDTDGDMIGAVGVLRDISQSVRLEQMRREFVANVSHELRTPLTSMRGFVEGMLDGMIREPEEVQKYLAIIHDETLRLTRLITDLLDLSQFESGQVSVEMAPLDIRSIAERARRKLEIQADQRRIEIEIDIPETLSPALGAEDRIEQVMINLLANAIKFNRDSGRVLISASERDGYVRTEVCDTGVGITEDDLPQVWDRFYRADKSRARVSGGTGLGLAIVKRIVETHGGKVSVSSRKGEGSCFAFDLPRCPGESYASPEDAHAAYRA
ncbi:MAG: HAMP domain-containing protein [Armatimonadetes bacterium]|nr:HAMP domain-containing protein [Armatimonadota bacterium]